MRYLGMLALMLPAAAGARSPEACTEAQARHSGAYAADLGDRALRLGLSVAQGQVVGPLRGALAEPTLMAVAELAAVASQVCPASASAAGPLTRAWLRLTEATVLCHAEPAAAIQAAWSFGNALHDAGCPLAREAASIGLMASFRATDALAEAPALPRWLSLLKL